MGNTRRVVPLATLSPHGRWHQESRRTECGTCPTFLCSQRVDRPPGASILFARPTRSSVVPLIQLTPTPSFLASAGLPLLRPHLLGLCLWSLSTSRHTIGRAMH